MKFVVLILGLWWGFVALIGVQVLGDVNRFEVLPTPRGTIVIDKSTGAAYQHPALPMFKAAR
jgi:hypothetical protein